MLELKDLLAEWKTVPELLGLEVGVEDTGNGKGMNSRELVIVRRYGSICSSECQNQWKGGKRQEILCWIFKIFTELNYNPYGRRYPVHRNFYRYYLVVI